MKKILKYEGLQPFYDNVIEPAKKHVPQWYKNIPQWLTLDNKVDMNLSVGPKSCMPFLDSITSGYMILLQYDLQVFSIPNSKEIRWADSEEKVVGYRGNSPVEILPAPFGYHKHQFTWSLPSAIELPQDYSMLITHPLNRIDLPFITLSGIVDGGWEMHGGSLPFYIREDFEGLIPKGTPIAQILPFKREKWVSEKTNGLLEKSILNKKRSTTRISGWYKGTHWKKKSFE